MIKNNPFLSILLIFLLISCSPKQEKYLIKVSGIENNETSESSGYINLKGDTVIPIGYYISCLTDTIKHIGYVVTEEHRFMAINQNGEQLFEVYQYDNGPDYLSDGLFRIIENNKIGYADKWGEIIIEPQFECATPFENGESKVAYECQLIADGEHSLMESDNWIYIDKKGKEILK
ncbi:MAG: WG repeat-containing protein [Bacteroidia bacterium]